jgi:hypothetical protein
MLFSLSRAVVAALRDAVRIPLGNDAGDAGHGFNLSPKGNASRK